MARPDAYQVEIAFASNPDDDLAAQTWSDVTRRVDVAAGIKISRGRTDEFGEIQPSKLGLTLDNRDGALTPGNAASPYYPNVKSGKKIRVGLLWKGNRKQIYQADPSFETGPLGWTTSVTAPPTMDFSTAQAFVGAQSVRMTLQTAAAFTGAALIKLVNGLIPGRQYTASIYIYVPTGTPAVQLRRFSGGATSNTSTNNAFQRLSITWTATTPTERLILWNTGATTAGQVYYADAIQVEEGAVATAFEATPAVFSWRFTGDVQEYPLAWAGGAALYAETNAGAADRLAFLGELGEYSTLIKETILSGGPVAYYPLDDPAGSTSGGDISGNSQPPLTIGQVGTGGTVTFGWDHTDGLPIGDYGVPDFYKDRTTSVQFVPSALGTPITGSYPSGKYLRATLATPISGAGATVAAWACFPSSGASAFGPIAFLTAADGSYLGCHKSAVSGFMTAIFVNMADGAGGVPQEVTVSSQPTTDFNVNYAAVLSTPSAGQGLLTFVRNGTNVGSIGPFPMPAMPLWTQVTLAGRDKTVDGVARLNASHLQVYDYAQPSSYFARQFFAAVQGRTNGASVDTTSTRLSQLLAFRQLAGSPAVFNVQGTSPTLIGPQEIEGSPIDAIHLVEDTEGGVFFINGAGEATFQLRNFRYNSTAALTLAADRLDPDAISFRGDAFGVRNDVTASRPDGASIRYVNDASRLESGRRKATVSAIPQTDDALLSIAARQAGGFGTQRNRITSVRISLLNDQALIAAALAIDIGAKLALTSLPSQAPAAAMDVFVEGWDEVIGETDWSMSFNTSPSEPWTVWQLGVPGRSELGVTTVVAF